MTIPVPNTIDLSTYIEVRLMGERPHLLNRRLPVSFVAKAVLENHDPIADVAYNYTISEEQVLAALLYYREHQLEIDVQDKVEEVLWQEMKNRT